MMGYNEGELLEFAFTVFIIVKKKPAGKVGLHRED
jgi:hypothetical protein